MTQDQDSEAPRILLGVTGGIAAYKAAELVRRLRARGADVRVVMTRGACEFVTPLTFQALSHQPVRTELFDPEAEAGMGHLELAGWADEVVVAPASADFIARLAQGRADDLLSTMCLATETPIWIAPAMNFRMWRNAATRANVRILEDRGISVLGPAIGELAEGETGVGRMLEPEMITEAVLPREGPLSGLRVLVSAGPTREPLDPVRYLTNRSSGRMGFAVAAAAARAGARVTLVSGPVALATPAGCERLDVESAQQMHEAVMDRAASQDIYIGVAAVSDYRPERTESSKIKKRVEDLPVRLVRNPDILAEVAALESGPFTVGFAAETDDVTANAREKLLNKKLDMIAANHVGGADRGFDAAYNALTVIWADGSRDLADAPKTVLARELITIIADRYADSGNGERAGAAGK